MEIKEVENNYSWTHFMQKNEHLIFHTPQYKAFIEDAFGCRYIVFSVLDEEGAVRAILPIVPINSRIFGNKLISSAYIEYGGFAGDEQYVAPFLNFIEQNYKKDNDFLEIRGGIEKFDQVLSSHLIKKNLYQRFVLPLGPEQEVWQKIQHAKRKAINKALKEVEIHEVPPPDINGLYDLYCRNMRRFGSPPYNKKYFESFYQHLVDQKMAKVLGAYLNGKLVSALLGFCYRDRVHILISVSDPAYQQHRPSDAVHWEFIRWACQNNYSWFDFGRVRQDSGQFDYKQKWGPTLLALPSYFRLWQGKEIPDVDPRSAKYRLLVYAWQKIPLWLTKKIGHRLRKEVGI